jgi:hypothetical protein
MRFRKKPVEIEAVRWDGSIGAFDQVEKWAKDGPTISTQGNRLYIHTLEGIMEASFGDWIIKGVQGELYPCKPDIFGMTYDAV